MAFQAVIDDDVFNKLRFVSEIGPGRSSRRSGKKGEHIVFRTPLP